MRMVFSIYKNAQVGGGCRPYSTTVDEPENLWKGGLADILIASRCSLTGEEEVIEIEGDVDALIEAFATAKEALEMARDSAKEAQEKKGGQQ